MTTANVSCPLALSPTTIAAWRDGALSADESARIAAHIAGCVACQRELAMYESLDNALRRQPVPASDGRLWRAVRAGMTSNRRPRNSDGQCAAWWARRARWRRCCCSRSDSPNSSKCVGDVTIVPASTATATIVRARPRRCRPACPPRPLSRRRLAQLAARQISPPAGITFGEQIRRHSHLWRRRDRWRDRLLLLQQDEPGQAR